MRVGLAGVLLLGSCVEEPPLTLGAQCDLATDCDAPLVCSLTRCRKECATLRDCPVGQLCVLDDRALGVCLLEEETRCALSSECPDPLVCRAGRCGNECNADRDCVPGSSCLPEMAGSTVGVCIDPIETSCRQPTDCATPLVCREGRCVDQCHEHRDCREGSRCVSERCVPYRGSDGGMSDAAVDAGGAAVTTCTTAVECRAPYVASFDCVAGACVITACVGARADCDLDVVTGCESDPEVDPRNCASCGRSCGAGGRCTARVCDDPIGSLSLGNTLCVTRASGVVTCSGSNDWGNLGRGYSGAIDSRALPPIGLPPVERTVAGGATVCAIDRAGGVYCWGQGDAGQIGEGHWTTRHSPRAAVGLTGVIDLTIGNAHVCARTATEVSCWGGNGLGQLGLGDSAPRNTPTSIGITGASVVSAGGDTTCVVHADGTLSCWGDNEYGEIGDGRAHRSCYDNDCSYTPVTVPLTGVSRVDVGQFHTCAIHGGGLVSCWGFGAYGGCATDPLGERIIATPRAVAGISDAREVSVSAEHTCVLRGTGTVSCWGQNDQGALGHGMVAVRASFTPVDAVGLTDAIELGVSGHTSCVRVAAGHPVCWGSDAGQLGQPSPGSYYMPTTLESYPP